MIRRSDTAEMRKYQPEPTTLFLSKNSAKEPMFLSAGLLIGPKLGIGSFGAPGFPHLGNRSTVQSVKNAANPRQRTSTAARVYANVHAVRAQQAREASQVVFVESTVRSRLSRSSSAIPVTSTYGARDDQVSGSS
jgi:hypothetical protein